LSTSVNFVWSLGACSLLAACTAGTAQDAPDSARQSPTTLSAEATSDVQPSSSSASSTTSATPSADVGAARARMPGTLPKGAFVPPSVGRAGARAPFLVLLHGYGGSGGSFARHFQFPSLAESRGFAFVAPDGRADGRGSRFWNAGDACCDFDRTGYDHVKELAEIVELARTHPLVDPSRVFVVGYSNGGFMAHRLACEVPGIAGIASVAGGASFDASSCKHAPRAVLQIHGDADRIVRFEGGHVLGRSEVPVHLAAPSLMDAWAKRRGCEVAPTAGPKIDLDPAIPGSETEPLGYACAPGVVLFKVAGAEHDVTSHPTAMAQILERLMSAAKAP
jgi:polyhydroxybutyrate depolymerase